MPNVSGCVSRTMKGGSKEEKKPEKAPESPSLHSESLEYLTRNEKFDYLRQLVNEDLARHHKEVAVSGKQILGILEGLSDKSITPSRRAFLREDLLLSVRKHESILKRLKLKQHYNKVGESSSSHVFGTPEKVELEYTYEPPDYVKKPELVTEMEFLPKDEKRAVSGNLPLEMVEQ